MERKSWTPRETLQLIAEFQGMPYLWNVFDRNYKNRHLKSSSLAVLAESFNTGAMEIQRKLHNLRCQYTSEVRKMRGRPAEMEMHSLWPYFNALSFLGPVISLRNVTPAENKFHAPSESSSTPTLPQEYSCEEEDNNMLDMEESKFTPFDCEPQISTASSSFECPPPLKRKLEADNEEATRPDEFELFGKLMSSYLRAMPLQRALLCQEQIYALLTKERLAQLDESRTKSASPAPSTQLSSP